MLKSLTTACLSYGRNVYFQHISQLWYNMPFALSNSYQDPQKEKLAGKYSQSENKKIKTKKYHTNVQ